MKSTLITTFFTAVLLLTSFVANAQARLTIENNSMRSMTVKVMKQNSDKGTLHETITIEAYSSETVYFSYSGYYFTKTKAVLKGKDPIYRKGQPFQVTNNSSGYSVMTLTFTITEAAVPQASGGKAISKTEFDEN
jgi:hypothetical protein